MKSLLVLLALVCGGMVLPSGGPAAAADLGLTRAPAMRHISSLPFPRSPRAAAVWGEAACWQACQRECTWGQAGCLQVDGQGRCLKVTDACDRSCQSDCRLRGGSYVDLFE